MKPIVVTGEDMEEDSASMEEVAVEEPAVAAGSKAPRKPPALRTYNARDRREIKQWRRDKDEKERLQEVNRRLEDKVQLLEGELWTVELATQVLDRHHKGSKHRMAEKLAKTLRQMDKLKDW